MTVNKTKEFWWDFDEENIESIFPHRTLRQPFLLSRKVGEGWLEEMEKRIVKA